MRNIQPCCKPPPQHARNMENPQQRNRPATPMQQGATARNMLRNFGAQQRNRPPIGGALLLRGVRALVAVLGRGVSVGVGRVSEGAWKWGQRGVRYFQNDAPKLPNAETARRPLEMRPRCGNIRGRDRFDGTPVLQDRSETGAITLALNRPTPNPPALPSPHACKAHRIGPSVHRRPSPRHGHRPVWPTTRRPGSWCPGASSPTSRSG